MRALGLGGARLGPRRSHSTSIFTRFFSASCSFDCAFKVRLLALNKLRVAPPFDTQQALSVDTV